MKLANLTNSYRKSNGNVVFAYTLSGSQAEIDAYKAHSAENYREDDGKPMYFSTRPAAIGTEIGISQTTGNYYIKEDLLAQETTVQDRVLTLRALAQFGGFNRAQLVQVALGVNASVAEVVPEAQPAG